MRTIAVVGLVMCFGVAFALMAGSGVGAQIFGVDASGQPTIDALEDSGSDADVSEEGVSGDVAGDNEPTLVGFAISGGSFIIGLISAVALLPVTLGNLGMPIYAAVPFGLAAQVIATVGLYQFITGREWI